MNNKLIVKMSKIEAQFKVASATMPVTSNRYDIVPVKNGGHKGIKVGGIHVWGVSPREYWAYLKAHK